MSNWPLNLQNISFKVSKLTLLQFYHTLELFIDHLKDPDEIETSYLDLDLDLQICHESLNVCVIL